MNLYAWLDGIAASLNLSHSLVMSSTGRELGTLNMMLFIKDKFNISGGAYHEMAQLCKKMSRYYQLKQRITELNKLWDIYPIPNGTCGVQQCLGRRFVEGRQHILMTWT